MIALLKNRFILCFIAGAISAWVVNNWKHDAAEKRGYEKGLKAYKQQADKDLKLARKHVKDAQRRELQAREFLEKVRNANTSNTKLSDDFIKLYNAAD